METGLSQFLKEKEFEGGKFRQGVGNREPVNIGAWKNGVGKPAPIR